MSGRARRATRPTSGLFGAGLGAARRLRPLGRPRPPALRWELFGL